MFALYVGGMGAKGKNFYNDAGLRVRLRGGGRARSRSSTSAGKKREAEALVPLELLEMCNLVGPESYVKERIAAFREAGVTNLQVRARDATTRRRRSRR